MESGKAKKTISGRRKQETKNRDCSVGKCTAEETILATGREW